MTDLTEIMQFLTADGYVIRSPQGHFAFTNKFYQNYAGEDIGAVPLAEIKSRKTTVVIPSKEQDLKQAYIDFIVKCNIPKRAETSSGEVYNLNQYSEKGLKAFKKILARIDRGELDMDILVKSTQLYYKSPVYHLKVGNYIGDGTWETHYLEMQQSIEKSTLKNHITDSIEHDKTGISRYRLAGGRPNNTGQGSDSARAIGKKPWDSNVPRPLK